MFMFCCYCGAVRCHLEATDVAREIQLLEDGVRQVEVARRFATEKCTNELSNILQQKKLHENKSEEQIISSAKVIGMTTTGAAQFTSKLENAFIPIVIVEEASEVLEAHIISALNRNVKHLIMIGDHKQLRPSPASFKMADKHKLDISLFERMILNELEYDQLLIQRRMRPEISQLIHPHIYKNLKNDVSVMGYPNVRGVGKNVFFVNHSFQEEKLDDNPSKINLYETEMVLELARYLILQDYSPDRITILTTYSAQLSHLRASISDSKRFQCLSDVKVCVVDNYQGEENDIILLTLVRSNKNKSIGFLKIENRVCVALSRAKIGFYCFGNFDLLCGISPLWRGIIETLKESSLYGEELTLYCQQHVEKFIQVKYVNDFKLAPEGGCNLKCNNVLNCGHLCTLHCHSFDSSHTKFICKRSCKKPILSCGLHHMCIRTCHFGEDCGLCMTNVEKKIPDCGHKGQMHCYVDPEDFDCQVNVIKVLPNCEHEGEMQCYVDPEDFDCQVNVIKVLPNCEHEGEMQCYVDPEDFDCKVNVIKVLPKCEHKGKMQCYVDPEDFECPIAVYRKIPSCGHTQNMACFEDLDTFVCETRCEKKLACGHSCENKCGEECTEDCSVMVFSKCEQQHKISKKCSALEYRPCKTVVEKSIPLCGHIQKVPCHMPPEDFSCIKECEKTLKCSHRCSNSCGQECETRCSTEMYVKSDCGHLVKIKCTESVNSKDLWKKCTSNCQEVLPCGHKCPEQIGRKELKAMEAF
ncbi:NFX1-type zinc finger-containing protein 1 [Nymphon striatum]|nr:NFX1-type zinc finger-containing protein 1 [Nymphon striatum]